MIIFKGRKRETERAALIKEIYSTRKELKRIQNLYNMEENNSMISSHIYEICALEEKLAYLNSKLRIDEKDEENIVG